MPRQAKASKSPQADSDNLKYAHCKKKGHKKSECRKLKKEKVEQEAAIRTHYCLRQVARNDNVLEVEVTDPKDELGYC